MGLLSYITGSSQNNTEEFPSRSRREQCWEARDVYYKCLDVHHVENPLDPKNAKTVKQNCSSQEANFEANCAKSWVQYFKEKRYVDIKKEKMLQQVEKENAQLVSLPGTRK